MKQAIRLLTTLLLASLASLPAAEAAKPVRVFLLAGQSNMEGKAPNALLDYHYLGSAIWFNRIGHTMGEAMKEFIVAK